MVEKQQIDIKQISIRQVGAVKTILAKSGFTFENVKEDSTKDGYTTYGTFNTPSAIIVVRLSNHICSMKNWTERYKPKLIAKPKLLRRMGKNIQDPYKERCFFSIVFKAFDYSVNDSGSWKAICNEYVFNPIEVEEGGTIGQIANDAKGLNRGKPSTINGIQPQIREVNNENENLPKELSIFACGAVMLSAIRANDVLVLTNTPSCFHDCLSASVFVIKVHCHCDKAVEL